MLQKLSNENHILIWIQRIIKTNDKNPHRKGLGKIVGAPMKRLRIIGPKGCLLISITRVFKSQSATLNMDHRIRRREFRKKG